GRGVAVDGQALVVDPHRDHRGLLTLVQEADVGDLAHVDAGDAHERALLDVVDGVERRLDRVVVLERDRLGEPEVDGDHADHDGDQPGAERRDLSFLVSPHGIGGAIPPASGVDLSPGRTWAGLGSRPRPWACSAWDTRRWGSAVWALVR